MIKWPDGEKNSKLSARRKKTYHEINAAKHLKKLLKKDRKVCTATTESACFKEKWAVSLYRQHLSPTHEAWREIIQQDLA